MTKYKKSVRRLKAEGYKYCEKHDQRYMDFLHECPICGGERVGKEERFRIAKISAQITYIGRRKAIRTKKGKHK